MLTLGRRMAPREIEGYIDRVTEEDIKRVAQTYLWDKDIAIAAVSGHVRLPLWVSADETLAARPNRGTARLQPYSCRHVVDGCLDEKQGGNAGGRFTLPQMHDMTFLNGSRLVCDREDVRWLGTSRISRSRDDW